MNLISVYTYEINDPYGDRITNFTSNHPIPFIIGQTLNPGNDDK